MQKLNNKIPQDIRISLDEIADKLWMKPSRACVLVGAGFSRNAIKFQDSTLPAPTWENLADDMIKKLNAAGISTEEICARIQLGGDET